MDPPADSPMSSDFPMPVVPTFPTQIPHPLSGPPPVTSGFPPGQRTLQFVSPFTPPLPWPQLPGYPRILSTHPSNLAGIEGLSFPGLGIQDTIATILYEWDPKALTGFFGILDGHSLEEGLREELVITFIREELDETSEEEEERGFVEMVPKMCIMFSRKGGEIMAGPFAQTSNGVIFPVQVVYNIDLITGFWTPKLVRYNTHTDEDLWGEYEPFSKGAARHVSGDSAEVTACGERLAKEWLAMRKWQGSETVLNEEGERVMVGPKVKRRMEVGDLGVHWQLDL